MLQAILSGLILAMVAPWLHRIVGRWAGWIMALLPAGLFVYFPGDIDSSRLTAVASLGVVGYGVSVIFILFGAPDLAMTQFYIETLSVILLVLVLYKLPRFTRFSRPTNRARVMTGRWLAEPLPVVGKLGTPAMFDLGVYLVVLGVVLLIIFSLAESE